MTPQTLTWIPPPPLFPSSRFPPLRGTLKHIVVPPFVPCHIPCTLHPLPAHPSPLAVVDLVQKVF